MDPEGAMPTAAVDRDGTPPSIPRESSMEISPVQHAHRHIADDMTRLHDFDAEALSPAVVRGDDGRAAAVSAAQRLQRGHVMLDSALLRRLRQDKLMSQQDLADECWRRNIPLSLTTLKRAELGRAVRFRIAREFARCFDVPVGQIVRAEAPAEACGH
jgi:hypothetical protein